MADNVRSQIVHGVFWNALEKFSLQGVTFVISVVLARLLSPSDFGLIGMLGVFMAVTGAFVSSGLGSALVQKHNCTAIDYSTVFTVNVVVSCIACAILFFAAPYISDFYHEPILVPITRVLGINVVLGALNMVHRSQLTIRVDFKSLAKINVISTIISGTIGIAMAYSGFGVWSLVGQYLAGTICGIVLCPIYSKWKPSIRFSMDSFRQLFGYGSKLLVTGIYSVVINNISTLFIGRTYTSADLGFYTKANQTPSTISGFIYGVLGSVTFPVMSEVKEDKDRMLRLYKKALFTTAMFVFPLMMLFCMLSKPFIVIVFTEKWLPCLVMMQLYCFARMFTPLSALNISVLNASGRSDLFMWMDLSKAPLILGALAITIPISVEAIVWGNTIVTVICFFINSYLPGRLFGYGALAQLWDWRHIILSVLLMCGVVYLFCLMVENDWLQLFCGGAIGLLSYAVFCHIFKVIDYKSLYLMIKNRSFYQ